MATLSHAAADGVTIAVDSATVSLPYAVLDDVSLQVKEAAAELALSDAWLASTSTQAVVKVTRGGRARLSRTRIESRAALLSGRGQLVARDLVTNGGIKQTHDAATMRLGPAVLRGGVNIERGRAYINDTTHLGRHARIRVVGRLFGQRIRADRVAGIALIVLYGDAHLTDFTMSNNVGGVDPIGGPLLPKSFAAGLGATVTLSRFRVSDGEGTGVEVVKGVSAKFSDGIVSRHVTGLFIPNAPLDPAAVVNVRFDGNRQAVLSEE